MIDRVDELFDMLGNNKKTIISALAIYIVVTLVILVVIWLPSKRDYVNYQALDINVKKQSLSQSYINLLSDIMRNKKVTEFKKIISDEYVNYTGKTKDEIVNELMNLGFFSNTVEIRGMNIYEDGNTYVYSTTAYISNNKRNINIIEKYPYEYQIVFDDFYSYKQSGSISKTNNINFTIDSIYRNLKYIKIDMTIQNLNNSYVNLDFNSLNGVQAILEDGTRYSFSNAVSTTATTKIDTNEILNKQFVFEIPAQLQEKITYIVFNGVKMEFSTTNIKIKI